MNSMRTWLIAAAAALAVAGGVGCTDVSRSGSDAPGVSLPAPAAPNQAPSERRSVAGSSAKDIAATLRANGVDDAEHWADVIVSHQPYPVDDPAQTKLRTTLTQERADPATIEKIANLLAP